MRIDGKPSQSKSSGAAVLAALALVAVVSACGGDRRPAAESWEETAAGISRDLQAFHRDPARALNTAPSKRAYVDPAGDPGGRANEVAAAESVYVPGIATEAGLLRARSEIRARLESSRVADATVSDREQVERLVGSPTPLLGSLGEMERAGLRSFELARRPWSDSYWPHFKGLTANRYADPGFPGSKNWALNHEYVLANPATTLIGIGRTSVLAPAEKYDHLMGDDEFNLTGSSWAAVRNLPQVESWTGICDGWAASSVILPEPVRSVTVTGAQGRVVRFYPSDIKAMSSLLWTKGQFASVMIGSRCSVSRPARDPIGRIVAPECHDPGPGVWHLAIVNHLGREKRSLIVDATYDHEIWNFPVWRYQYAYFNPQTLRPVESWAQAVTPIGDFRIDKFKTYRHPEAKFVAGVSMSITYAIENRPVQAEGTVSLSKTVRYLYDLELDAGLNIVGGEWYSNLHPDFLWSPRPGARAVSIEDARIGDPAQWTGTEPMPEAWTASARMASRVLQPLAAVVERLFALSSAPPPVN